MRAFLIATPRLSAQRSLAVSRLAFTRRGHATAVPEYRDELGVGASSPSDIKRWTKQEISDIYHGPLLPLVVRAAGVHAAHHDPTKIQLATLMNIKSGGCSEDCSYCSQSSRYDTATQASRLLQKEPVIEAAKRAKANGSTRFCMGAAWRDLQGRKSGFNRILEMVTEIRGMGMEVCTTLGMLSPEQARQLKEAGLTAYNHNLDTSREFYPKVITTRSYDERLDTISAVHDAGISVCSGGILGLGETDQDRIGLIWEVGSMEEHPESFPVNALVPIPGTPLEKNPPLPHHTILRTIATARIVLPSTIIRLAAGRQTYSEPEQALAFMAGANAIFTGDTMLTTPCTPWDEDKAMLERWGLSPMRPFEQEGVRRKEMLRGNDVLPERATVESEVAAPASSAPAPAM
ncbi:biotin synthase [Clavulina sp. PMI_390]|nr:biotin synthase [Clavulina sp. PMI_390]